MCLYVLTLATKADVTNLWTLLILLFCCLLISERALFTKANKRKNLNNNNLKHIQTKELTLNIYMQRLKITRWQVCFMAAWRLRMSCYVMFLRMDKHSNQHSLKEWSTIQYTQWYCTVMPEVLVCLNIWVEILLQKQCHTLFIKNEDISGTTLALH